MLDTNYIAHLTDINAHTEARLEIAKEIGNEILISFYERILKHQEKLGYLHPKLSYFRYLLEPTLRKEAEHKLGLDIYPYL